MEIITKPFDSYKVTYSITNPNGKDYARIDFFATEAKVGQIFFGDSIVPGSYASVQTNGQISLYYPLQSFQAIAEILRSEKDLALYVEFDDLMEQGRIGGITNGE
jgi:hypothetical protein